MSGAGTAPLRGENAFFNTPIVINVLGQQIRTLVNQYQSAGDHSVVWDERDQGGNQVASGIYFYRMMSAGMVDTKKMLLMK